MTRITMNRIHEVSAGISHLKILKCIRMQLHSQHIGGLLGPPFVTTNADAKF